jgi:hypothetical protein
LQRVLCGVSSRDGRVVGYPIASGADGRASSVAASEEAQMNSSTLSPERLVAALAIVGLAFAATASSADARNAYVAGKASTAPTKNDLVPAPSCIPRSQCCRICSAGTACGNWCTRAIFNCEKARGCACDASKVCK